jgi:hypothetical protein
MSDQKNITPAELESLLNELRNNGESFLSCVKTVKDNYDLFLSEAVDLVLNSQAFADRREEISRNLQAGQEEIFEAMMEYNRVKSIKMVMTPNQTDYTIELDNSQTKSKP